MKRIMLWALFSLLLLFVIAQVYRAGVRPEQINRIMISSGSKDLPIIDISNAVAQSTLMTINREDFDFGGRSGTLQSVLIFDSRSSIMIRSISTEECVPEEGERDPKFSRSIYSVSIYRTSIFSPRIPLNKLSMIIEAEARRHDARLVTESEKCTQFK